MKIFCLCQPSNSNKEIIADELSDVAEDGVRHFLSKAMGW